VFLLLLVPAFAGAAGAAYALGTMASWGSLRGVVLALAFVVGLYACAIVVFRLFQRVSPLRPGDIPLASQQEFVYHVYQLFFLMLFYPVMRSGAVPVPVMRVFYLALGAKLGPNTYSSGILFDPGFVTIGENTIVGQYALLVPHVHEGAHVAHFPIRVGSNVTIGAHAVVMSDVEIGDGAIVAVGAVVPKGTRIGAGEVWGGVPARRLGGQ
jgi:serine acetyltransferase